MLGMVGYTCAPLPIIIAHIVVDAHGHAVGSHSAHGPEGEGKPRSPEWSGADVTYAKQGVEDVEALQKQRDIDDSAAAQIIGVFILEFGVILHRYNLVTPSTVHILTGIVSAFL
jgi:hypothetical protein